MSTRRSVVAFVAAGLVAGGLAGSGAAAGEALGVRLAAERSSLLAGSRTHVGAILTLVAPDAPAAAGPSGVALALVIDRSGSMSSSGKMEMVRVAGSDLVDRLDSGDEMGLVAYDDRIETVRPMAGVLEPDGIKSMILGLTPRGWTDLGGGLSTGIGLFDRDPPAGGGRREGAARRLLLLTDGLANRGETRAEVLAEWARRAFLAGSRISTVGLGSDYNEDLLAKVAHAGGGEFYYVAKKSDLPALFRKELEEGRTVVTRDLAAMVAASEGARFVDMVGYPFTGGDETAREVKIGDLFAREKRTILLRFEVAPPDGFAGRSWVAATVALEWKDALGRKQSTIFAVVFDVTRSERELAAGVKEEVRARVVEMESYVALDEAMGLLKKGERDKAVEKIKAAEEKVNEAAKSGGRELLDQAGQLAQARREIEQREDERSVAIHNKHMSSTGYRGGAERNDGKQSARSGGSAGQEASVAISQPWLVRNQSPDGSWGEGGETQRATSLCLLSLLAAGHTERHGSRSDCVRRAVAWLVARQSKDGRIGGAAALPGEPLARFRAVHEHALAALALAEAHGMARVPGTGEAAQKAVDWLAAARPFEAAERALSGEAGLAADDVAGIAWCVMAMKSARTAKLGSHEDALADAERFIERHRDADGVSVFRRGGPDGGTRGLDAMVGLVCRMSLGEPRARLLPVAKVVTSRKGWLPSWGADGAGFDWNYAYFGNLVCFQLGGDLWRTWNGSLRELLIAKQRKGDEAVEGSWDPAGTFDGRGRALPTAVASLCLEVYYRYLPLSR